MVKYANEAAYTARIGFFRCRDGWSGCLRAVLCRGQLGLKVLVIDHSEKVTEKIRICGGDRANFTNRDVRAADFLSNNPSFCRSALSRYTPGHFIELMQRHGITFHEKHKGQLFCDRSPKDLITMLLAEYQSVRHFHRVQTCAQRVVDLLHAQSLLTNNAVWSLRGGMTLTLLVISVKAVTMLWIFAR